MLGPKIYNSKTKFSFWYLRFGRLQMITILILDPNSVKEKKVVKSVHVLLT